MHLDAKCYLEIFMPDCSCFTHVPGKKCSLKSWLQGKFYPEEISVCYPYAAVYSINVKRYLLWS